MRTWTKSLLAGVMLFVVFVMPASAHAAYEYGTTARWPWSGNWWPMLDQDRLNLYEDGQAMDLYDDYVRNTRGQASNAQGWERANHRTTDPAASWWGHCHAWAAAAIMTREPPASVSRGGVNFHTNAVKGLVTELYYEPKLVWLAGSRNNDDNKASASYQDVAPAWMDWLLRYYVKYYRYPFIMDISAGKEVWNFPIFAYTRDSTTLADGSEAVTTRIWYSNPLSSHMGTDYFSRVYTYTLKSGTLGKWTGNSVDTHPDFAWVPTGKDPMPHVSEPIVEEIIGNGFNA